MVRSGLVPSNVLLRTTSERSVGSKAPTAVEVFTHPRWLSLFPEQVLPCPMSRPNLDINVRLSHTRTVTLPVVHEEPISSFILWLNTTCIRNCTGFIFANYLIGSHPITQNISTTTVFLYFYTVWFSHCKIINTTRFNSWCASIVYVLPSQWRMISHPRGSWCLYFSKHEKALLVLLLNTFGSSLLISSQPPLPLCRKHFHLLSGSHLQSGGHFHWPATGCPCFLPF